MLVRCQCGHEKQVKDELRGQVGECPKCKAFVKLEPAPPIPPSPFVRSATPVPVGFVTPVPVITKPWTTGSLRILQGLIRPHFPEVAYHSAELESCGTWLNSFSYFAVISAVFSLLATCATFLGMLRSEGPQVFNSAVTLFGASASWFVSSVVSAILFKAAAAVASMLAELSVAHAAWLVDQGVSPNGFRPRP